MHEDGDGDDDEYALKSEGDIDIEHDFLVKHIHEITADIEKEKEKLQQLETDYKGIKGQVVCVRVAKMKLMIEAATKDCLKDSQPKTFCSKIQSIFTRSKS